MSRDKKDSSLGRDHLLDEPQLPTDHGITKGECLVAGNISSDHNVASTIVETLKDFFHEGLTTAGPNSGLAADRIVNKLRRGGSTLHSSIRAELSLNVSVCTQALSSIGNYAILTVLFS